MSAGRILPYGEAEIMALLIEIGSAPSCQKSSRAAALVTADGRDIFAGVNRPAAGTCDGSEACRRDCPRICVHAEQMALISAGAVRARGAAVYHLKVAAGSPAISGAPSCAECSKLMLAASVATVWLWQAPGAWRAYTAGDFHSATLATLGLHTGARR